MQAGHVAGSGSGRAALTCCRQTRAVASTCAVRPPAPCPSCRTAPRSCPAVGEPSRNQFNSSFSAANRRRVTRPQRVPQRDHSACTRTAPLWVLVQPLPGPSHAALVQIGPKQTLSQHNNNICRGVLGRSPTTQPWPPTCSFATSVRSSVLEVYTAVRGVWWSCRSWS